MEENFVITLFDVTHGIVEVETTRYVYTYHLDGAIVRRAAKCARFSQGKAWAFVKKHTPEGNVHKEKRTMSIPTDASKHVRRERAVQDLAVFMAEHGNFFLFRQGKTLRVFPAPCTCPHNRISGVLFFKWVKRNPRYKKFDRLILHTACYKCKAKSGIMVIDPDQYDPRHKDFVEVHPFLHRHGIKHWQLKVR